MARCGPKRYRLGLGPPGLHDVVVRPTTRSTDAGVLLGGAAVGLDSMPPARSLCPLPWPCLRKPRASRSRVSLFSFIHCAALFSGAQVRASRGSAGSRRRAPSSNASLDSRSAERAPTLSETRPSALSAPRKKGRVWGVSLASHAKPLPTQSLLRAPPQKGGVGVSPTSHAKPSDTHTQSRLRPPPQRGVWGSPPLPTQNNQVTRFCSLRSLVRGLGGGQAEARSAGDGPRRGRATSSQGD